MSFNIYLFKLINSGAGSRPIFDSAVTFVAQYGPEILVLALVAAWFVMRQRRIILAEAVEAALIGLAINFVITLFYFHPRPFMTGLCVPLFPHSPDSSFPSDHATLMFTAAIYLIGKRSYAFGCGLFILAVATSFGRVYCGVHFPADIAGSFGVAFYSVIVMLRISDFTLHLNAYLINTCLKFEDKVLKLG